MNNAAIFMIIFILSMPVSVKAMQFVCNGGDIVVIADEYDDFDSVCDAVEASYPFLASINLSIPIGITIKLFNKLPPNGQHNSIGCYDKRNNEIRMLNFENAIKSSDQLQFDLKILMNRSIWQSYVIHELAHASSVNKFTKGVSMFAASEYISSVAQLETLSEIERDKILKNYSELSGFENPGQITMTYYVIDPVRFSVNAYLHYSKPENGPKFIKKLLREGLPDESE